MAGINKVILIGNLGKDPEVRFMPSGGAVANITVATSDSWKDRQTGEQKERTEWHRVAIFGKLAEVAGEYLKKGSKVYIEGQLQTRKWQNQQGQDQYTTEVVVQGFNGVMQMLDSRGGAGAGNSGSFQQNANAQQGGGFQAQNNSFNQQSAPQGGQNNNFGGAPAQQQPMQQQGGFNQAPQQQGGFQKQQSAQQPQGGFNQQQNGYQQQPQQSAPKVNPQEPSIDFDDDIPF